MTDPTETTKPESPAPLCFVDTETDGVHPGRQAWEVALIRRDYTEVDASGYTEVDASGYTETGVWMFIDIPLDTADPYGLQVGGFYERHPVGKWLAGGIDIDRSEYPTVGTGPEFSLLDPGSAAEMIAQVTHGAHLVGVVPSFDAEVFDKLLRRYGLIPAWHYHLVDVEAMAVGWLSAQPPMIAYNPVFTSSPGRVMPGDKVDARALGPLTFPEASRIAEAAAPGEVTYTPSTITPPWRSDELSRACGVEPPSEEERHTALGDAEWAKRWYDVLTGAPK